jgi:Glycosyl hydrolase family 79 C-terminal beta domain
VSAPFRGRYGKTDLLIEAAIALVIVLLVLADTGGSPPRADVTLTVLRSGPGRPIPAQFLGLSMEYTSLERYAGQSPAAINPVFRRLIENLSPGQPPVIRIGGDTTDRTWWPVAGLSAPPGIKYTLDARWMSVLRALTQDTRARLILGINLEAGSATIAQAEARALVAGVGASSVRALELGNEPELYGRFAWYRAADGARVTGRPSDYDYVGFAQDFTRVGAGLPSLPTAGPAWGNYAWTGDLGPFLASHPRVELATLHRYPLQRCFVSTSSPRFPSIANLLTPAASVGLAERFATFATIAHAHRIPFRLDELNSVSCGAVKRVSQSFASALWVLDVLFELARAGIDGVNIHTFPQAGYNLFSFYARGRALVFPEYYGLLLFARAAPPGARLIPLAGRRPQPMRAWATIGHDGSVRVVLINADPRRAHVVGVRIPGLSGAAALLRLQAPDLAARSGVTLGGRSFGSQTDSGVLEPRTDSVSSAAGKYTVTLPAASAALLSLRG